MEAANQPLNLMIVIASVRPERVGGPVGTWIAGVAREHPEFNVTVADLREINLPMMDEPHHPRLRQYTHEHTKQWSALVDPQDAFIFVFPEYNHALGAPLKNAIDYLVQEWRHKPVGLVSYGGISGGLRAAQQLKPVVVALGMMPIPSAVTLPFVKESISDEDVFVPNDSAAGSAETMLADLWRWSVALHPLRTGAIPAQAPVGNLAGASPGAQAR